MFWLLFAFFRPGPVGDLGPLGHKCLLDRFCKPSDVAALLAFSAFVGMGMLPFI